MSSTEITLVLGDATLRGTATGRGPTVLLLHAGGERRGVWASVAALLAEGGLRTVAYDLRGHGESSGQAATLRTVAADVNEMIGREPAPIVVVGASLGGYAALAALAKPSTACRAAGLVLVDAVPSLDPGRARGWLDDRGLRNQHRELAEDILASGRDLLATAAALNMPILVVRAGRKSPLSDVDVDRLGAANRRVTITSVPDSGHLVARDAPAELAQIVSAYATAWLSADADTSPAHQNRPEHGG